MAALTLLQLVTEFCKRRGIPLPATVAGAQDDTTLQMWGLMNEGIADLSDRFEWQQLRTRFTFVVSSGATSGYSAVDISENATANGGSVGVLAGIPDCKAILNKTIWDVSARRPVYGPLTPEEWESLLNLSAQQAVYTSTLFGNYLRMFPVAPITNNFALEYISAWGVYSPTTLANQETYVLDTDVCRFPARIALMDLKWRWNAAKGLAYAEDQRVFETALVNLQGRELLSDVVLDSPMEDSRFAGPGLLIAAGNWNVP